MERSEAKKGHRKEESDKEKKGREGGKRKGPSSLYQVLYFTCVTQLIATCSNTHFTEELDQRGEVNLPRDQPGCRED